MKKNANTKEQQIVNKILNYVDKDSLRYPSDKLIEDLKDLDLNANVSFIPYGFEKRRTKETTLFNFLLQRWSIDLNDNILNYIFDNSDLSIVDKYSANFLSYLSLGIVENQTIEISKNTWGRIFKEVYKTDKLMVEERFLVSIFSKELFKNIEENDLKFLIKNIKTGHKSDIKYNLPLYFSTCQVLYKCDKSYDFDISFKGLLYSSAKKYNDDDLHDMLLYILNTEDYGAKDKMINEIIKIYNEGLVLKEVYLLNEALKDKTNKNIQTKIFKI